MVPIIFKPMLSFSFLSFFFLLSVIDSVTICISCFRKRKRKVRFGILEIIFCWRLDFRFFKGRSMVRWMGSSRDCLFISPRVPRSFCNLLGLFWLYTRIRGRRAYAAAWHPEFQKAYESCLFDGGMRTLLAQANQKSVAKASAGRFYLQLFITHRSKD